MKIHWHQAALSAVVLAAAASALLVGGCGKGGTTGGRLASVNGENISMDDFLNYIKTKDRVRVVTQQGQVAEARVADTLAYQAMEDLILRKVVLQLAKDEGVFPDDDKVKAEIEFRKQLNPEFVKMLTGAGLTLDQIKEQIRVDLATEYLLTKGITISDTELDKFILENKLDVTPATADMYWAFARTAGKKTQIDSELKSGKSFASVARQLTDSQSASEDAARYGGRVVREMPKELQDVIKKTGEGQTTDWVAGAGGWGKFYVERKTQDKKEPVTPARREFIRRAIAKDQGQKAKDLGKRLADFLMASKVDVDPKDLKGIWDKAIERAKKERKFNVPTATGNN